MRVLWKVNELTSTVASVRYRCLIPIYESIKSRSAIIHFVRAGNVFDFSYIQPDCVVFVKTIQKADVSLAKKIKNKIYIVFDVCDNVIANQNLVEFHENFKELLLLADTVTVPTAYLRDSLKEYVDDGGQGDKIKVIDDPSEMREHIRFCQSYTNFRLYKDALHSSRLNWMLLIVFFSFKKSIFLFVKKSYQIYLKLVAFILKDSTKEKLLESSYVESCDLIPLWQRLIFFPYVIPFMALNVVSSSKKRFEYVYRYDLLVKSIKECQVVREHYSGTAQDKLLIPDSTCIRLLWFGNSGVSGIYGMTDLLLIKEELEKLNSKQPILLTIVSNNYHLYKKIQKSIDVHFQYVPWSPDAVYSIAADQDCVVLPNSLHVFAKGKSSNRTLLALSLGLPVVATKTPDLEKLANCISFGDWAENILRYKRDEKLREEHLKNFTDAFAQLPNNPRNVWSEWEKILIHRGEPKEVI